MTRATQKNSSDGGRFGVTSKPIAAIAIEIVEKLKAEGNPNSALCFFDRERDRATGDAGGAAIVRSIDEATIALRD